MDTEIIFELFCVTEWGTLETTLFATVETQFPWLKHNVSPKVMVPSFQTPHNLNSLGFGSMTLLILEITLEIYLFLATVIKTVECLTGL